ncbi:MAG: signal peptidase II [Alphaproteobacteria bacterium]
MNTIASKAETKSPRKAKLWSAYFFVIAVVIFFDQLTKWMVMEMIMRPAQDGGMPLSFTEWLLDAPSKLSFMSFEVLPFYNIVMVWNYGVSFGILNNNSADNALILIVLAALISFFLLIWMLDSKSKYVGMALALAVGGAIGNIIDRARFGAVIDYIDIHVAGYHWPAFNIADSCVVLGIGFVIIHSLFFEKKSS